ncbi:beta-class carbonic anhydrase [Monashia sp. NPDC004114]
MAANRAYAGAFDLSGFDGIAQAGVAIVTCMDSRIDPLNLVGLKPGDAKIFRNPGARVDSNALEALVLATHLLNVGRILIVPHTRCAMASNTEAELQSRVGESAGQDATWMAFHAITNQVQALREDCAKVRSHPLIADGTLVGGFLYDVDTGLLEPIE